MIKEENKIKTFSFFSVLISFSLVFFLAEIFFRYKYLGFDKYSFNQEMFSLKNWNSHYSFHTDKWPVELDSNLGWKLKTGNHTNNNPWKTIVNIDEHGFRKNKPVDSINYYKKTAVFLGDSYTFGDGVNDSETFPAFFQSLSGKNVLNAGVPAYGIDQIYLRAIQLLEKYNISEIFFCFIPDDIIRCNYSILNGVKKPFFRFNNKNLEYVGISGDPLLKTKINLFQKYGGFSFFIHTVMKNFANEYWLRPTSIGFKKEHNEGEEVSAHLFNKLKIICEENNVKLYLVPLMSRLSRPLPEKLSNGIKKSFVIININEEFEKIQMENNSLWNSFYNDFYNKRDKLHFSSIGNKYIAKSIFSKFQSE